MAFLRCWSTWIWTKLAPFCAWAIVSASVLHGEPVTHADAVAASQKRAMIAFPEVSKAGSPINSRFLSEWHRLQAANDALLKNDDWPMILVRRCAEDLGLSSPTPVVSVATPPTAPAGTVLQVALPTVKRVPTEEEKRTVEKYRIHILAKILIFREDGVIARIRQMWNRPIVDSAGRETGKVYPDKYLVGDTETNSVFIEGTPPANVATGEETEMYVYPCGMLQEHSTRYRKFTTNPLSVIEYINGGGTPSAAEK